MLRGAVSHLLRQEAARTQGLPLGGGATPRSRSLPGPDRDQQAVLSSRRSEEAEVGCQASQVSSSLVLSKCQCFFIGFRLVRLSAQTHRLHFSSAAQWHPLVFFFSCNLMSQLSFLQAGASGIINPLYDSV